MVHQNYDVVPAVHTDGWDLNYEAAYEDVPVTAIMLGYHEGLMLVPAYGPDGWTTP